MGGSNVRKPRQIERWAPVGSPPRIGPCRDPLALWFLEFDQNGARVRRYYEDRAAARYALCAMKAGDSIARV
jgi:hypothetical protein